MFIVWTSEKKKRKKKLWKKMISRIDGTVRDTITSGQIGLVWFGLLDFMAYQPL